MAFNRRLHGKILYVYKPDNPTKIVSNIEIIDNKWVPDARITNEVWSIEETQLIAVAKIRIIEPVGEYFYFSYGENTARTYKWKYEILKKYNN